LYDVRKSGRSEWAMDANLVCQALPALDCKGETSLCTGVRGQTPPKRKRESQ